MVLSWLMRIHLGWTNCAIPGLQLLSKNGAPGGVMTPEYYLQLMTMHGTIMVFFVLTTAPFAAFGNYFLPIQVGAEDMPFPRFNMMSFWVTFVGFPGSDVVILRGRWTDPRWLDPVCAAQCRRCGCRSGRRDWASFCGRLRLPSSASASCWARLNFITTTLDMRTKGMSLMRLPLSAWAWFITSVHGPDGVSPF